MLALGANGRGRAGLLSALRPQDVFATSLYTGTGASQSVNTGFAPDLVWAKTRNNANGGNAFFDRLRGAGQVLYSNATGAELSRPDSLTAFNPNGFSVGADTQTLAVNASGSTHAAWSIKRASKFFDIVTYTGDGTSGRVIPHALGIKPGMIIVKRRDTTANWQVWHASLPGQWLLLNATQAANNDPGTLFGNGSAPVEPTATGFTVGSNAAVNASSGTYVAYLFAHDPDTTNGIVQCGSFTTDANGAASVALGWQPQWLLFRASNITSNWLIYDTARGWNGSANAVIFPNTSGAETNQGITGSPNSSGFSVANSSASANFIYCGIRAPIT